MKLKVPVFCLSLIALLFVLSVDAKVVAQKSPEKTEFDQLVVRVGATVIQKSPNDDRTYAAMMLSNHLQVVLVSDPTLENSAASLAVAVGSTQDPETQPGLAHYLEHMLFLGTKRYPEPDGFMKYTQSNGGWTNAYTRYDKTNYHFMIGAAKFDEALDRFSEYFISPTLDPTYADKERNAVNNEWSMQKKQDGWNLHRISGLTANPQSPYHKFNIGNLDTLSDKRDSKLQTQLIQLYQTYYSANLMRLTLVGKQSIPELKALAEKYFSAIPNKNVTEPKVTVPGLSPSEYAKNIYYKPFQDIKYLIVEYPITSLKDQWQFKTGEYVHSLITSEEPGTLCEQLRVKGFAVSVTAEIESNAYGEDGYLRVVAQLNDVGVSHQDEVVAAVLSYVELMKKEGLNPNYFKEQKAISAKSFSGFAKQNPVKQAVDLTMNQFDLPIENLVNAGYVYQEYKPELIQKLMDQLDTKHVRIWHVNQKEVTDTPVDNFDGQYAVKNISGEEFSRVSELAKKESFKLPPLNNLFSEGSQPIVENKYLKPHLVVEEKGIEAFLVQPEFYREDKGSISIEINSSIANNSPRNAALAFMLNETFKKRNLTLSDRAYRAGLNFSLARSPSNSTAIAVSGFTAKHQELVIQAMKRFAQMEITQNDFNETQKAYTDIIRNKKTYKVLEQAYARLDQLTHKTHWDDQTLIKAADKVTYKDLVNYAKAVKKSSLIRLLAAGNYSEEQIKQLAKNISEIMPSQVKPKLREIAKYQTPKTKQAWDYRETISLADDATLLAVYRDKKSDEEQAQLSVLGAILGNAFFAKLRTEEQLGYAVNAHPYPVDDIPGFVLLVQSSNTPVQKIADRVNLFLKDYEPQLQALDPQQLEQTKQAMLNNVLQKPTDFYREMGLYLNEFWHAKYNFDGRDRYIASLKKVTKDDLIKIYRELLLNPKTGSILLQYKGTNSKGAPFIKFGTLIH